MTIRRKFEPFDLSLALTLFSAAVVVRVYFLSAAPFDGFYGQDAYAYHDFAQALRAAVSTGAALGPFYWPLGYPTLLAGAYALFGAGAQTAQPLNILLGALISPLVYVLARQIGIGRAGSAVATLVMAVSGQAVQSSLVVMSDIPALALATASAVTLWIYVERGGAGRLATSTLLLVLAGITRWIYLALALPWMAVVILERGRAIQRREIAAALLGAALVLAPQLAYSATNPFQVLTNPLVTGWSPANFTARSFDNADGHFSYDQPNAVFYARPFYDAYTLSPLLTPLLLVGAWTLRRRRAAFLMLLGWALIPYLFLMGAPYQNVRLVLIVMPVVALFVGAGADGLLSVARTFQFRRLLPVALAVLVIGGLAHTFSVSRSVIRQFIANQQADKDAVAWVAAQIPDRSTLYTYGLTLTLRHYTDFNVHELYFETPATLAAARRSPHLDYLFCNVWVIEHQWQGRTPQLAFDWLRTARGLIPMGHFGNYQLYRLAR